MTYKDAKKLAVAISSLLHFDVDKRTTDVFICYHDDKERDEYDIVITSYNPLNHNILGNDLLL